MLDDASQGAAAANRQIIRREGEYWTIVYGGEICRLKDTNGVRYLCHLLHRPHQRIAALEIERSARDREASADDAGRGMADDAARERARVNVTRALSSVLKRIAANHPELGRHLGATLRTGAYCTYSPDPRVAVGWEP